MALNVCCGRHSPRVTVPCILKVTTPCGPCPPTDTRYTYNDQFQLTNATRDDGSGLRWEYDAQGRTTASYRIGNDGSERLIKEQVYEPDTTQASTYNAQPLIVRYPSVNNTGWQHHEVLIDYNDDGLPTQITERGFAPTTQTTAATGNSQQAQGPPPIIGYEPIERSTSLTYENGRITQIDGHALMWQILCLFVMQHPMKKKIQQISHTKLIRATRLAI